MPERIYIILFTRCGLVGYCEIKEELKILDYLLEHDDHRLGLGTSTIVVLMIRESIIWLMEDMPFIQTCSHARSY